MSQHQSGSYKHKQDVCLHRRKILTMGAGLGAALLTHPSASMAKVLKQSHRVISLHNLHTDEKIKVTYWEHGRYVDDALADINHLLRDHRTNEIHSMDLSLLDLLYSLNYKIDQKSPFHVISGYRSPKTNQALRQASSKVAKNSFHMQGKAIDICVPGCQLSDLHKAALSLKRGGVGYYPASNFIHVDTGRVRSW